MHRSILRWATTAAACSLFLASCYGQFALTRKLYTWNGQATGNVVANSVIFWGLLIIPVYEILWLGDFLIFNTVEAATGTNPFAVGEGGVVKTKYAGHEYQLQPAGNKVSVFVDGRLSYRYREAGDRLVVEDLEGKVIRTVPVPVSRASGWGSL